jgi:hypothetical protein
VVPWWSRMSGLVCDGLTLLLVGPGWGSRTHEFEMGVFVFVVGRREWGKWGWFNWDRSGDGGGGLTRYCVARGGFIE